MNPILAALDPVFSALDLTAFPAYGLLALTVWMILTGRLVPRATAQAWEKVADKKQETIDKQAAQIDKLLEVAHTAQHVFKSLPAAGGDPNAVVETTAPAG